MMVWRGDFSNTLNIQRFYIKPGKHNYFNIPGSVGCGQLPTGKMADHFSKRNLLFAGMLLKGLTLIILPIVSIACYFAGWRTAMVYPKFLATIAAHTHPADRVKSLGVFRLWHDAGYAIGAILTGIIADVFGVNVSILFIGLLTCASAMVIISRMGR